MSVRESETDHADNCQGLVGSFQLSPGLNS